MDRDELIKKLQQLPPGAKVRYNVYEHDFTHARTASDIRSINEETVEVGRFRGNADRIKDEEFDKDPEAKYETVYVIR